MAASFPIMLPATGRDCCCGQLEGTWAMQRLTGRPRDEHHEPLSAAFFIISSSLSRLEEVDSPGCASKCSCSRLELSNSARSSLALAWSRKQGIRLGHGHQSGAAQLLGLRGRAACLGYGVAAASDSGTWGGPERSATRRSSLGV